MLEVRKRTKITPASVPIGADKTRKAPTLVPAVVNLFPAPVMPVKVWPGVVIAPVPV